MPATRRSKSKLNSDLAMAKMKPAAIISERKSGEKRYWLMKSEPESRIVRGMDIKFSIDDLERDRIAPWDGVRNYEARNNMRAMRMGDEVLFYHSNCADPGVVGTMTIVKEAYPDEASWNPKHPYYDAKCHEYDDRWVRVDVKFQSKLSRPISLRELKQVPELKDMFLVKRGRLSVQPVTEQEYLLILNLASSSSNKTDE